MRCPACNQPNPSTARYCVECGVSLAPTTWAPSVPSAQTLSAGTAYAPAPYAVPQPVPSVAYAPAPEAYPQGATGASVAYAPYGYAPAPAPVALPYGYAPAAGPASAPSLVNTVTVNQVAPSPPPPAPPPVVAGRSASGLGILARAAFLLGSGIAVGVLWVAVAQAEGNQAAAVVLAFLVTAILLLIDIVIVERLAHK